MGKYILKRLVYIVIVFFIVSLLMYADRKSTRLNSSHNA